MSPPVLASSPEPLQYERQVTQAKEKSLALMILLQQLTNYCASYPDGRLPRLTILSSLQLDGTIHYHQRGSTRARSPLNTKSVFLKDPCRYHGLQSATLSRWQPWLIGSVIEPRCRDEATRDMFFDHLKFRSFALLKGLAHRAR